MRPLKKATQKNVPVNNFYYTREQLDKIAETVKGVCKNQFFADDTQNVYISLAYVKDLKVKLHDGYYTTVAVMNTGEEIFVEL